MGTVSTHTMGTLRTNDGYCEYSRPGLWQEKVPNCAFFATPLSAGDHTLKVARRGVPCRAVPYHTTRV